MRSSPAQQRVAVVLPARDAVDRLGQAVDSIVRQSYPVSQIALSIGPSSDGTEELAERLADQHPSVFIVPNPTGRTPTGLNLAIAETTGDIIIRVDAGSELPAGYVQQCVNTLEATGAANVGAVQHATGTTPFERAVAAATRSRFGVGNASYRFETGEPRRVDTAYLGAFRRRAIEAVDGYDERFTRNQDYELNWRLRSIDQGVWLDPSLRVTYRPRSDLGSLGRQYWQYGWWRAETLRKHPDSVQPRQLAAPVLLLGLAGSAVIASVGYPRLGAVIPALYATSTAAAAVTVDPDLSPKERVLTLAVFPTLHLSWAAGLIASGLTKVVVRRRAKVS